MQSIQAEIADCDDGHVLSENLLRTRQARSRLRPQAREMGPPWESSYRTNRPRAAQNIGPVVVAVNERKIPSPQGSRWDNSRKGSPESSLS